MISDFLPPNYVKIRTFSAKSELFKGLYNLSIGDALTLSLPPFIPPFANGPEDFKVTYKL